MDPRNPYQAQGMPRRPGDNRSNPGVIVLIVLIVLLLLLAVVGGFVAFKIFKDRMTTNVDVSSLIRVKTSAVKKKDISVSADDLLNAAGVSSAKSNYADMQQAAQSFVESLTFTTTPSTGDLTNYAGQEIEVTAKGTPAQIEKLEKTLGIRLSGLNYKKKVTVESNLPSSSNASNGSSGSSYSGNSSSSNSSSSSSSSSSTPSNSNVSHRYTASSIENAWSILEAGEGAGEYAVRNATTTNMANHSGSVNKSAFAGDNDRWTDADIGHYATYFGKGSGDTDILAYFYRVTMYDNKNEEYVTSFEGACYRGITENTSANDVRNGMVDDG